MRIALDTNLLVYAEGVNRAEQQRAAQDVLVRLRGHALFVPVQVVGELFAVLRRKTDRSAAAIRENVSNWLAVATCVPSTPQTLVRAMDLAADHGLSIWDAMIFAAAAEAGCGVLLTEDLQDGFLWGGVRAINPFRPEGWARLQAIVAG